jgi:hypothetical protein
VAVITSYNTCFFKTKHLEEYGTIVMKLIFVEVSILFFLKKEERNLVINGKLLNLHK